MAISHRMRLPLLHLAVVCILSLLGLQIFNNGYRACIIFILPLLHLAAVCIPSLEVQIFNLYHRTAVTIVTAIRNRIRLRMLLIVPAVCWILSLALHTFYHYYEAYVKILSHAESLADFFRLLRCHPFCRIPLAARFPEGLPTWKIALLVLPLLLALTTALILLYLLIRYVVRKRSHNEAYPRWVNGDMERSPSRDTLTTSGNASPNAAAAPRFGQLGCMKHGHQVAAEQAIAQPGMTKMRVFDYGVLASATGGFKNSSVVQQFVRGIASGMMYRGMLISDKGLQTAVVIKRFNISDEETCKRVYEDLKDQLVLRHRNLLCPLGYCLKNGAFYVVYEYMVDGSLDQHLLPKEPSPNQRLSWPQRCRIIKGIVAGLHYLHKNFSVHGSVKASNILLDQDMTPRLGDFGFLVAAVYPSSALDFSTGCATDVFSLGMVMVDILCGESWNREHRERSIPAFSFLVNRAWDVDGNGCILGAIDADLAAASDFDEGEAEKMLQVGLACSHPDPTQRPSMEVIVDFLTGKAGLPEVSLKKKDR